MLRDIVSYEWPYPHFISERALPEATLSEVRELFRTALPWETREGEFYRTYRFDLGDHLGTRSGYGIMSREFLTTVQSRIADAFGPEVHTEVQVMAHRMVQSQSIGVHNDNPGLGYENWRMLIYLSGSEECSGGTLHVHSDVKTVCKVIDPQPNMAFAFEMSPRSLHAVGPVHSGTRDALIFNFYHVGNTLRIERDVRKALGEAKLPAGIARVLGLASMIIERKLTGRAAKDARDALSHATDMARFAQSCGCVEQQLAGLLRRRLGFLREIFPAAESLLAAVAAAGTLPAPDMARRQPGETASTGDVGEAKLSPEDQRDLAIAVLADWAASLPRRHFDPSAWRARKALLEPLEGALSPLAARKHQLYFGLGPKSPVEIQRSADGAVAASE